MPGGGMRARSLLWALAAVLAGTSGGVELYECATPKGLERHCVERDASSANASYVKGTLPGAGYFEGILVPGATGAEVLARVNWFYAAERVVAGSATYQYSESAGGITSYSNKRSWASGISDLRGGVETLASSTCTLVAQSASAAQLRECMYSAPGDLQTLETLLPNALDGSHWADVGGIGVTAMTVCHRDVTTLVSLSHATGGWTGLQRDALRFTGRDSHGLTGVWRSPSGEYGPLLVTTFLDRGLASLIGMSCDSTGASCEAFSVALVGAGNGAACKPAASPAPKDQYGVCPEQDAFAEMVVSYTELLECSRPTTMPPYQTNAGEEAREYHCIDYDASSTPVYVKGTYGMHGYFEGPMTSEGVPVGRVAWYQTSGVPLAVSYGSATVSYALSAPIWNAWASDLNEKVGANGTVVSAESSWASNCTVVGSPTSAQMRQKCLWSAPGRQIVAARVNALDGVKFESSASDVTDIEMCHDDLSTNSAINTKYGAASCATAAVNCTISNVENGTFSPNGVRMNLQDSYGFVGPWKSNMGGHEASGGALYVVTNGGATLQGFECVLNETVGVFEGCQFKEYQLSAAQARCDVLAERACKLELDWMAIRQRKLRSTAFSGGLGDLASHHPATYWDPRKEYGVWACLRDWDPYAQLKCGAAAGEHVCFKYDEVSEAFHSWGRNRDLRVVEPFV